MEIINNVLTCTIKYGNIVEGDMSFFYGQKPAIISNKNKIQCEVEKLRTKITLACTDCKQRNYSTTKEKRNHPDRMETKKYCRFCNAHTVHKETK